VNAGERALLKLKAWLAAAVGVAGGLVYGPLLVQAAIIAVLLAVVVVVGLAHAHDMTVGRAAALYGGRAILALAKAAAIVLVEWPLRAGHRMNARYDTVLRVQLAIVRAAYRLRDRSTAAAVQVGTLRGPVVALTAGPRLSAAEEAVVAVAAEAEDRATAVMRRAA
jgi:hypothetical protein